MKRCLVLTIAALLCPALGVVALGEDLPPAQNGKWLGSTGDSSKQAGSGTGYLWKSTDVDGGNAQLLTLFCRNCFNGETRGSEVPVVSVLRDTAGDRSLENDRVSYVWLLSVPQLSTGQRILSAVPFYFWHVGHESDRLTEKSIKPQLNLTAPHDPVLSGFSRQLVQWIAFDPLSSWVRAPSRSFQSNAAENTRFHLEETISYLRNAPASNDNDALTESQLKIVIARLELRKSLLGGLVDDRQAARAGDETGFEEERVRSRNWELLRQCAEKTGLYFEPVDLGGATGQYGVLWYPENSMQPAGGTSLKPIWRLLNIQDPWEDARLRNWDGLSFPRDLDDAGRLLPAGSQGTRTVRLIPLAFYSLTYPKVPLLLADFRDKLHVRRREIAQRSINQITSGVIGISRLTNWYYFAGAMAYNFVSGRHGTAVSQVERLDCYSQFRVHLAGDMALDRRLYDELTRRARLLTVSPLSSDGDRAVQLARARYSMLMAQTQGPSELTARLDRDRRAEIAIFGQTAKSAVAHEALHFLSLGLYTQRIGEGQLSLNELDRQRRFAYALNYLGNAVRNGTRPEVEYSAADIAMSVATLNRLAAEVASPLVREHAASTLQRLSELTQDPRILADCSQALASIQSGRPGMPAAAIRASAPAGVTSGLVRGLK